LNKNVKKAEMEAILQKRAKRDAEGKKTIFMVRGRIVSDEKIERYEREGHTPSIVHDDITITHVFDVEGNTSFL
jgi:hypothetical protein